MEQISEFEDERIEGVPSPAVVLGRNEQKYGSVPGLDDEELADPDELERHIIMAELEPILLLPSRKKRHGFTPDADERGGVDWGAFGTVDFERTEPEFDKARYKADKLKEKLADVLILLGIVKERLPGKAKYLVLKYLKMGIITIEDIVSDDMRAMAGLWLRAKKLQDEIALLRECSRARRERRAMAFLEA